MIREETLKKYNLSNKGYAFKVCRIEPENNLDIILKAFIKTDIQLIIVGNWNNSSYGKTLRMNTLNTATCFFLIQYMSKLF